MTTTIATTFSPTPAIAPAQHDVSIECAAAMVGENTAPAEQTGGEHPLAKFGPNDLHWMVQSFASFAPVQGSEAHGVLAQYTPQGNPQGTHGGPGTATPLYDRKTPAGTHTPQLKAPPPTVPSKPIDVQQMEALNKTVQNFNVKSGPVGVSAKELGDAQRHIQAATDALKAGDYKKAEQELSQLGFPLPAPGSGQSLRREAMVTATLLGITGPIKWGKGGSQELNDVNGFAANAMMMKRMATVPGGVANPPTEAQATQYMRDLGHPAKGTAPTAREIMQAASDITNGTIVHYSSAGKTDPVYGENPKPHAFYKDRAGQIREFDSKADAHRAAKAGKPQIDASRAITQMHTFSPDQWKDITSQGTRAGRYVGDCESKAFLQTRLLTEAGFTSVGTVDVQRAGGHPGHMFGVLKAPDGTVWVTSNQDFKQVAPADPKKGVTQADLDVTLRSMTAGVYGVKPDSRGVFDLHDFKFTAAATANLKSGSVPTDSIRRSSEMNMLGRSETLIP